MGVISTKRWVFQNKRRLHQASWAVEYARLFGSHVQDNDGSNSREALDQGIGGCSALNSKQFVCYFFAADVASCTPTRLVFLASQKPVFV